MVGTKQYTTLHLFVRSLLPSAVEGLACVGFGTFAVAAHLFLMTLSAGNSLPQFLNGEWATFYTAHVVEPLQKLFANQTFNNVLLIVLWGFVGLCVYLLVEYSVRMYKAWRREQTNIQYVGQTTVHHPLRRTFAATVVWRLSVVLAAVLFFVAAHPAITRLLADPQLLTGGSSLAGSLTELGLSVIGWALLAHIIIVFLRLFLMRTRLFAEALY